MWYFIFEGKQYGPIDDNVFQKYLSQGKITPNQLIWREGWDDWRSASTLIIKPKRSLPRASLKYQSIHDPMLGSSNSEMYYDSWRDKKNKIYHTIHENKFAYFTIATVITTFLDLLQPIHNFTGITAIASLSIWLIALLGANYSAKNKNKLSVVSYFFGFLFLVSSAWWCLQVLYPNTKEHGIIGTYSELARDIQRQFIDLEVSITRLEGGIDSVKVGVEGIRDTTDETLRRSKNIEKTFESLQKSEDPREVAKRNILNSGYSLDNAGYAKALAETDGLTYFYEKLQISGDEKSLRTILLSYPVTSNEFTRIKNFIDNANSNHYATKLGQELIRILNETRQSGSVDNLWEIACNNRHHSFNDKFIRNNLKRYCTDEVNWLDHCIEFGKKLTNYKNTKMYHWWYMDAKQSLIFTRSPTKTKKISINQLIEALKGRVVFKGEFLEAEAIFTLHRQESIGPVRIGSIALYASPKAISGGNLVIQDTARIKENRCWYKPNGAWGIEELKRMNTPLCRGRIVIRASDKGTLTLQSLISIKPL